MTFTSEHTAEVARLIRAAKRTQGGFHLVVHGDCIHGIEPGDRVRSTESALAVGELVLYAADEPKRLFVHRIVSIGDGSVVTKGDTAARPDPEIPVDPCVISPVEEAGPAASFDGGGAEVTVADCRRSPDVFDGRVADDAVVFHAGTGEILLFEPAQVELLDAISAAHDPSEVVESTGYDRDWVTTFVERASERRLLVPD